MGLCEDRHEIEKLLYLYAERVDAGDLEGVASMFIHAEVINSKGEVAAGELAMLERLRRSVRLLEDGTPRTRHVVTNPIIDVADDRTHASSRSTVIVFQAVPESFPLQPIWIATYRDEFSRIDEIWRFRRRANIGHLVGDMSSHLKHFDEYFGRSSEDGA